MRWEQRLTHAAASDVGLRRKNNEDACFAQPAATAEEFDSRGHVFIVADGMGGHAVGELASKMAVETVSHLLLKGGPSTGELLRSSITAANAAINDRGRHNRDFDRMGTTCTALVLSPGGAYIGHVGDSRGYRLRRDRLDQLTFDHSLDWEYRRRYPNRKDDSFLRNNRNVITRSLGPEQDVRVDVEGPFAVLPRDRFLLCSDGLSGLVSDDEIAAALRLLSCEEAVTLLIDLANLRGGNDNCTVVVCEAGDLPAGVPPAEIEYEQPTRPEWTLHVGWMAGFAGVALLLVLGLALWFSGRPIRSLTTVGLGGALLIPLIVGVMRSRERQLSAFVPDNDDRSRTVHNRPHASAVALPPEEFASDLASACQELARTAREDNWAVVWDEYEKAAAAAQAAADERRMAAAVRDLARAIHCLMSGLTKMRTGVAGVGVG